MRISRLLTFAAMLLPVVLFAQARPALVATGYDSPVFHRLAPGQLVTLFVSGLPASGRAVASAVPLPTELAGVSVTLHQAALPGPVRIPLLSVEPLSEVVTALVVQMPFEMEPGSYIGPITAGPARPDTGELQVSWGSEAGPRVSIIPVQDNIKLLRSCDAFPEALREDPRGRIRPCLPTVTHAGGNLVNFESPARAGEVVVFWAFGLGRPPARPVTGGPAPAPIIMPTGKWGLHFAFGANAPAKPPFAGPESNPVYVGVVPGYVGLYQINMKLPEQIPSGTPACTSFTDSNLTVTVWGATSSDAISICVR